MSEQKALAAFEAAKAAAQEACKAVEIADAAAQAAGNAYRRACIEADAGLPRVARVSVQRYGPDRVVSGHVLVRHTAKSLWTRHAGSRGVLTCWRRKEDRFGSVRWDEVGGGGGYQGANYITDEDARAAIAATNPPKGDEVDHD